MGEALVPGDRLVTVRWLYFQDDQWVRGSCTLHAHRLGIVISRRRTAVATPWDQVDSLVRCGLVARWHVRMVRSDGSRIVLGMRARWALERVAPPSLWRTDPRSSLIVWHRRTEAELAQRSFRRR